jgi:hypothetical protein
MRGGHHFCIGKSHDVCQDYAASSDEFAALSDGCSIVKDASGNRIDAHTDVGARLLVRAAFAHSDLLDQGEYSTATIHTADGYRRQLGMSVDCLSATLLALKGDDTFIDAFVVGDGAVFGRQRNGTWTGWRYEFDGPPYYLRYTLSGTTPFNARLTSLGGYSVVHDLKAYRQSFPLVYYDLVVAMSDGAFSFTKNGKSVPFDKDFALRLLDFRRMGGKFMVRHLRGTLAELEREGIVNQDDISMVALYAGD